MKLWGDGVEGGLEAQCGGELGGLHFRDPRTCLYLKSNPGPTKRCLCRSVWAEKQPILEGCWVGLWIISPASCHLELLGAGSRLQEPRDPGEAGLR